MSTSEPLLSVDRLSVTWGSVPVLQTVTFTVARAEYFVLLGPNGSGKTTLLRTLAGLEHPSEGRVRLDGADLADVPTHRRGFGWMSQDPALFAHRTVYENIAYAPLLQRRPRSEVTDVVGRMVELLRLAGFEDRSPNDLSGGERQRVALARTLAARPRIVLLDEPFASIDPEVKQGLRTEFRRALSSLGTTAIHVTHDREEGMFLGDRMGLLFDGRLDAVGPPGEVYRDPRTSRIAQFLGYNLVASNDGLLAVHPSDLELRADGEEGISLTVEGSGPVGREELVVLRADDGRRFEARSATPLEVARPGRRVRARWTRAIPVDRTSPE